MIKMLCVGSLHYAGIITCLGVKSDRIINNGMQRHYIQNRNENKINFLLTPKKSGSNWNEENQNSSAAPTKNAFKPALLRLFALVIA